MTKTENIDQFLNHSTPILDARSHSEFVQGHLPGAFSFPLFNELERAKIGTLYKRQGKEAAVKLGLHVVGPKLFSFVEHAEQIASGRKSLRLYCWRGGMRSSSLAWLLETAGFQITLLKGGYKQFRKWTLDQFKKEYSFHVLGGFTGSGKTELLQKLKIHDEQIIDLENIARHKGSSFGHLGKPEQPSTEHFENILAFHLSQLDVSLPIWIEDESQRIGSCHIPADILKQMHHALSFWVDCPKEERIERLFNMYGCYPPDEMIEATQRLVKKLGSLRTKQAIQCIQEGNIKQAIALVLEYYDQAYTYSCNKREKKFETNFSLSDPELIGQLKSPIY